MTPDIVVKVVFASLVVAIGAVALIGGLVTSASGRWRDGDRLIVLAQLGPFVRGQAHRGGGYETYRGFAFAGWVWFSRRSYGVDHLRALGFTAQTAPVVEGQVTARLKMRVGELAMKGTFVGMRFDFSEPPVRILAVSQAVAAPREWQRDA